MDTSFFRENGYQIVKGLIDPNIICDIKIFLNEEKDSSLNKIKTTIPFENYEELIKKRVIVKCGVWEHDQAAFL